MITANIRVTSPIIATICIQIAVIRIACGHHDITSYVFQSTSRRQANIANYQNSAFIPSYYRIRTYHRGYSFISIVPSHRSQVDSSCNTIAQIQRQYQIRRRRRLQLHCLTEMDLDIYLDTYLIQIRRLARRHSQYLWQNPIMDKGKGCRCWRTGVARYIRGGSGGNSDA